MIWALLLVVLIVLFIAARSSPATLAGLLNRLIERVAGGFIGAKEDIEDVRAEWRDVQAKRKRSSTGETVDSGGAGEGRP